MTRFEFIVQEERPVTNEDEDDNGRLEARITLSIGEARFGISVRILSCRPHPITSLSGIFVSWIRLASMRCADDPIPSTN